MTCSPAKTLKDFEAMMERLKPYLPSPSAPVEPKPQRWRTNPKTIRYGGILANGYDHLLPTFR